MVKEFAHTLPDDLEKQRLLGLLYDALTEILTNTVKQVRILENSKRLQERTVLTREFAIADLAAAELLGRLVENKTVNNSDLVDIGLAMFVTQDDEELILHALRSGKFQLESILNLTPKKLSERVTFYQAVVERYRQQN